MKVVVQKFGGSSVTNADRVMEHGVLLPCAHGLDDDDIGYVIEQIAALLETLPAR